jgi:hypothetical protein
VIGGRLRDREIRGTSINDGIDEAKGFAVGAEQDVFIVEIFDEEVFGGEIVVVVAKAEGTEGCHVFLDLGS